MITSLGRGAYRVEHEGSGETIYVAGPPHDRWVFWRGQIFRGDFSQVRSETPDGVLSGSPDAKAQSSLSLTAPMPARVARVLVHVGERVAKGDTLLVLEAMKMELPVRAPGDGAVAAVHCREGELVQGDALLLELASSKGSTGF